MTICFQLFRLVQPLSQVIQAVYRIAGVFLGHFPDPWQFHLSIF